MQLCLHEVRDLVICEHDAGNERQENACLFVSFGDTNNFSPWNPSLGICVCVKILHNVLKCEVSLHSDSVMGYEIFNS